MPKKQMTAAEHKVRRAKERRATLAAAKKISKKGKVRAKKMEQQATKEAGLKMATRKRLITKKKK